MTFNLSLYIRLKKKGYPAASFSRMLRIIPRELFLPSLGAKWEIYEVECKISPLRLSINVHLVYYLRKTGDVKLKPGLLNTGNITGGNKKLN
jgi:hypothetical protein